MNYELAKKLKDAGWPQSIEGMKCVWGIDPDGKIAGVNGEKGAMMSDGFLRLPNLSELIEACGNGIFNLLRQSQFHQQETGFKWKATFADVSKMEGLSVSEAERIMVDGLGSTPEEAVVNLWLLLNK